MAWISGLDKGDGGVVEERMWMFQKKAKVSRKSCNFLFVCKQSDEVQGTHKTQRKTKGIDR